MSAPAVAAPVPAPEAVPDRPGPVPVPAPGGTVTPDAATAWTSEDNLRLTVAPVLAGLTFPARRWEVLAEADLWGSGAVLLHRLAALPDRPYPDLGTLLRVLRMVHGAGVRRDPPRWPRPTVR